MSPASHMVGRLRKLYGIVWNRMRFLNERAMHPPIGRRGTPPHCAVEQLEPRLLLNGDAVALGSLYDAGATSISPAWFESLLVDVAAGQQGVVGTLEETAADQKNTDLLQGADDLEGRWIVQLAKPALEGVSRALETATLFSGAPFGLQVIRGLGMAGQILVQTYGVASEAVHEWFAGNTSIAYFGPDVTLSLQSVPNDPGFSQLWGMHNTGQTGGTPDADIDAPEAWDIATGSSGIVVGIIDTGVDYTHPDLAANIWTNPGEVAGNGLDDDGNGFVDDIHGYDFVNNDGDPMDDNRHGTHVAGTIAAVGDNSDGVAGVNWSSSIMAIKFLNSGGSGSLSNAVRAINYATMMRTDFGVDIRLTSNSWGGGGYEQSMYDAIAAGGEAGILFIAAAGNDSANNDVSPHYPSSYDLDNVIAVAATDHNDNRASFSCYGATSVDLAAPGVNVYSTVPGNGYASLSGTSMATPHVSGVAALAWATAPGATAAQIRDALFAGVDPIESLSGKLVTGGRLNARGTLAQLGMNVAASDPSSQQIIGSPLSEFSISFTHAYDPSTIDASDLLVNGLAADSLRAG